MGFNHINLPLHLKFRSDIIGQITKIITQKRPGRYNVYINNHYAFPVGENVLVQYRLLKGMEINEKLQQSIIRADQVDRYYQLAINFLAHHLRTEHELKIKLSQAQASDEAIVSVIDKLKQNHLVNDQNYANSYVRSEVRMKNKGPQQLEQFLKQKAVKDEQITVALQQYYPEAKIIDNGKEQAVKLFHRYQHDAHQRAIQKIRVALVRKGYDFESIANIMEQVEFPVDNDQEHELLKKQFAKFWQRNRQEDFSKRCLKTKQSLYRKGFSIDDINHLIDQQVDAER